MAKYKVDICGINTNDIIVLKNKETIELFKKLREGDLFTKDLLINGNLKLVLSVLKKFYYKVDNMDDLFQIGCVGLIKAIDNFDLSYDVQFSTYAVPMILGEIKRYIRDNNIVRVSRSLKDIAYKSLNFMEEYYSLYGKEPNIELISKELGFSEYDIGNALLSLKEPVSMYEPIYNDGGDTIYLFDQIEDKRYDNDISNKLEIENAIADLDEREKYILDQRYVIGKTQMEVAESLDISQAQVSRLEKKAIKELKKVLK